MTRSSVNVNLSRDAMSSVIKYHRRLLTSPVEPKRLAQGGKQLFSSGKPSSMQTALSLVIFVELYSSVIHRS